MRGRPDLIRIKRKPFFVVLFILILAIVTPVLADFLGPNRTVTETTSVCKVVLYECKYIAAKDQWKYRKVDDWSCSNEGKPWQGYDNYDGDCGLFSDGRTQWGKVETLQTVTTTHPETTIASVLLGCNLNNGWCNTASNLSLNGIEPLSGYNVLAIEGILNGQSFACSGDNCSVPLNEGNNDFSFWAISSWGDSSQLGTTSAKVDTVSPSVGLDLSGSSGSNGWYVSPTTVTATGSDSTSGLSSVFLSADSGAWASSTTLNEDVYHILVQAEDNAGNIANSTTTISVDTTTPTIGVSVNGTTGNNGWYSSSMQVSATSNDATSGVASLESSLDGGVYQTYNSPVSFADGYHTVQFKAVDKAGNQTETSVQEFYVDTLAPAVDLPAEWEANDIITYKVQDDGSGLSALRIVIEDEDEKFAKVAWDEAVSGNKFKDGTIAPPGEYLVWVKVTDVAGNERIALGRVIVPQPFASFSLIQPSKSSTEIPTPPADLFNPEDLSPTANLNPDVSTSPSTGFGGSTAQTNSTTVRSLTLTSGSSSALSTTPSNVLWGAAAASMLGAATAYALEEQRKRKEAEARRQEEGAARKHSSHRASRDEEPSMTRQDAQARKHSKELQKIWDANGAAIYEANREYKAKHGKEMDATSRSKAIKDATMNGVFNAGAYASNLEAEKTRQDAQNERMASKMTRFEKEEEVRWQAQQSKSNVGGSKPLFALVKQDPNPPDQKSWWDTIKEWWNNLWNDNSGIVSTPTQTPVPRVTFTPTITVLPSATSAPRQPKIYEINGPMTINQIPQEFRCTLPEKKIISGQELYSDYYYRCKLGEKLFEGIFTDTNGWWWQDGQTANWQTGNLTKWKGIKDNEDVWQLGLALGLDSEGANLRSYDIKYNNSNFSEYLEQAIFNKFWHFDHGVYATYGNSVPDPDAVKPLGTNGRLIALGSLESLQKRIDGPAGFTKDDQIVKPASEVLRPPYDGDSTNAWEAAMNSFNNFFANEPTWIEPSADSPYEFGNVKPDDLYYKSEKVPEGNGKFEVLYRSPLPESVRAIILTFEQFTEVYSQLPK